MINNNQKGFTLIELLVTVSIIGILVAISVPLYIGQQRKAAMAEAQTNLQNIRLLEEQFMAENGRYAPDADSSTASSETASYTVAIDTDATINNPVAPNIRFYMPGFRPGRARDLNYDYIITCPDPNGPLDPVTGAPLPSFVAFARPVRGPVAKAAADRTGDLWINDRNQNNFR